MNDAVTRDWKYAKDSGQFTLRRESRKELVDERSRYYFLIVLFVDVGQATLRGRRGQRSKAGTPADIAV